MAGLALMRFRWQIEKQNAQNQIDRKQLHSLEPIRFAVAVDLKDQLHGDNHGDDLRERELKIHRSAEEVREEDEHGCDEECDLQTRSYGNPKAKTHLVFHRHDYCRRV